MIKTKDWDSQDVVLDTYEKYVKHECLGPCERIEIVSPEGLAWVARFNLDLAISDLKTNPEGIEEIIEVLIRTLLAELKSYRDKK